MLGVEAKDSEILAARVLLGLLDVAGAVLTVDALHTNRVTTEHILAAGAHYVLTMKGNSRVLFAMLKALPWAQIPATTSTDRGHGRSATRTIKVLDAPAWIEFAGAAQVAQLRRTVTRKGKTVQVVYLVTSASARAATPETLANWANGQWGIENQLHWVHDVTFDEDRSQIHTGHAPQNMAALRKAAIAILRTVGRDNIARALRHHARDVN